MGHRGSHLIFCSLTGSCQSAISSRQSVRRRSSQSGSPGHAGDVRSLGQLRRGTKLALGLRAGHRLLRRRRPRDCLNGRRKHPGRVVEGDQHHPRRRLHLDAPRRAVRHRRHDRSPQSPSRAGDRSVPPGRRLLDVLDSNDRRRRDLERNGRSPAAWAHRRDGRDGPPKPRSHLHQRNRVSGTRAS